MTPAARAFAGAPVPAAEAARIDPVLADLNVEQREAVTHGEGPLLIVAGAGTGKTEVITRRIAWLIATKRARPEEILALTFTEKAAAEMESRVDLLVPYGWVGATLSTFHAFGDRLVRESGIEIGLTRDLTVCTRAEVLVFLREHLFALGLERFLPLGDPDRHLDALLTLFDRARDEDVSPEAYAAFASGLAAQAGDDPERRDRAQAEVEKARVYARYTRLMLERGRVDFSDQLALALRLMRERPHRLRQLQDQYRYLLVDEFQDTNHVQFEMVKRLAGRAANVTVVGDDDQSIYRFRGAKLANLMAFLETYPGAREVVLKRNYRSRQNLLDAAHRLIRHNDPDRLEAKRGYDKRLIADVAGLGTLERLEFQTATDEADQVAQRIADAVAAGSRRPRDFAILARAHDHLAPFLTALRARGVPFHQSGSRGLYGREEVRLCLSMLRVVADPDDSLSAFHLLGSPLFGADPVDLARLSSWAHRHNRSLRWVAETLEAGPPFTPTPATREACARFVGLARQLTALAALRPTSEVLYAFVHESGFLGQLATQETLEAEEQVKNIAKLFSITQRIGAQLEHDRVAPFTRYLGLLIDAGDDPAAAEVDVEREAVHVLTAHNAKGLEFPVVFLVSLVEDRFPARGQSEAMPLPPELTHEPPSQGDVRLEEERRLFYVGMTRAREALVLTHAADYGGKTRRKMSRFVAEALAIPAARLGPRRLDPRQAIERHAPSALPPAAARAPLGDAEPLRLSSSRIDDYLTCPLKYRYAHEVQVPLARDPGFMYGDAIHHAIRHYYKARLLGHPVDADQVVRVFEEAWSSEGFISREHEERRLEQGRRSLSAFVAREDAAKLKPLQIEQAFKFRRGNNVVEGRWDRIDERKGGIVIVDFKTAEVAEPEDAHQRAKESLRGSQLGLYALAYRETRGVTPAAVELQFVESGRVGHAAVEPKHLDAALERIDRAAAGIRAADFAARPEYNACRYCPYESFCPFTATRGAS
ncbi:MAG: ATP-dependent helicase [Candidatus Eisenbacteria bacterium]|uniref:DNA 3'-5' helicase n=1 Tax=Eiseniibacteriota bacterium TaxID=2212470 RepID=A0A538UDY5_UNCEI|nr:MAG: ATP-dependent helicase [Candidatus Eisenbacteria bacterium]